MGLSRIVVVLDEFDLGVGILFPTLKSDADAISP